MNVSHLLTTFIAAAMVCFISGAEASPHFSTPTFSPLPVQAGLKCGLVNGQVVCGNSSGKHRDDQQGNDDDHHGKKKNNDDDAGLSECTIQGAGGGGGCKGGFKYVCEKMKSGKKCCGCVADKSQGTSAGQSAPSGGGAGSSSGGIKPIEEKPADTLLLPYCEEKNGQLVCTPQQ